MELFKQIKCICIFKIKKVSMSRWLWIRGIKLWDALYLEMFRIRPHHSTLLLIMYSKQQAVLCFISYLITIIITDQAKLYRRKIQ